MPKKIDLNYIDYSCYCSSCGERITEDGDAGGRCTACGTSLLPFGHDGLKQYQVILEHEMSGGRKGTSAFECWAETEEQVRKATEDAGFTVDEIHQLGECEKYYHLPIEGGIKVYCNVKNQPGGSIESDLKVPEVGDEEDAESNHDYNVATDAIESLVLAHACAGIDVSSPDYLEGLETALEACANNL